MNKDVLTKVKYILRNHREIYFPVKYLYANRLISQDLPHIDELILDLKAQPDLAVTKSFRTSAVNGPAVMLRERISKLDEIIARVRTNLGSTLQNLNNAYAAGIGEMAPDEEDLLLEAMQRTKNLRRKWSEYSLMLSSDPEKRMMPGRNGHEF